MGANEIGDMICTPAGRGVSAGAGVGLDAGDTAPALAAAVGFGVTVPMRLSAVLVANIAVAPCVGSLLLTVGRLCRVGRTVTPDTGAGVAAVPTHAVANSTEMRGRKNCLKLTKTPAFYRSLL